MATAPKQTANGNGAKDITMEDLTKQLSGLKEDVARLTSSLGAYGQSVAGDARDTARERAAELHAAGMERARETQRQAEDFIKTQPGTALGIAAGMGFLVGLVMARR